MVPNYDGTEEQPSVLPSRVPNCCHGATGIAVGNDHEHPPHNLREITGGIKHLVDNPEAKAKTFLPSSRARTFHRRQIMGTAGSRPLLHWSRRIIVRARHTFEQRPTVGADHHRRATLHGHKARWWRRLRARLRTQLEGNSGPARRITRRECASSSS